MKKFIELTILLPFIVALICVLMLIRLIGALFYNLTDFVQYNGWDFQETKDTIRVIITIPSQVYEALVFIVKN